MADNKHSEVIEVASILGNFHDELNRLFKENQASNGIYHKQLIAIFSTLYSLMDTVAEGWEVNIQKCAYFNIYTLYEVSEFLAKIFEKNISQDKLALQDLPLYIEISSMLDALNRFIASCGSIDAFTSKESYKVFHAKIIGKIVDDLDKSITQN